MERWAKKNGYKHVLAISLPLVASMGSLTLMQFTDRMFLANYSADAISAALPAGIASFTAVAFFMCVANYVNACIAQYTGACAFKRIGVSVWQGIYFSLMAACFLALLYFVSGPLFNLIGHSPSIQRLEVSYFNILTLGAGLVVMASAMACFYTGRGLTKTVMVVHAIGAAVNIPLDYCLINGVGFFIELGIVGAALATVTASAIIVGILSVLIFSPANRSRYGPWKGRAFDKELFGRLMHYGLPSGIQFFLEIFGITFFVQMVGRLGDLELAASNIALSIESLSFLPLVGFHISTATLVGQAVGRIRPGLGTYATMSALHITMAYMMVVAVAFIVTPKPLLNLFKAQHITAAQYTEIMDLGVILMRFVAVFFFLCAEPCFFRGHQRRGRYQVYYVDHWCTFAGSDGYPNVCGSRGPSNWTVHDLGPDYLLYLRPGNCLYDALPSGEVEVHEGHRVSTDRSGKMLSSRGCRISEL